jgi:hypothetical protein
VALSERVEQHLSSYLEVLLDVEVQKTPAIPHGLPDLALLQGSQLIARVEVKAQSRAFMKVKAKLPQAGLLPYETVALNLSDFLRYIQLHAQEHVPLFIVWAVKRPCIGMGYWGQRIDVLQEVYRSYGNKRRFQRGVTQSDIVNGEHKGVTVNYHFSIRELLPLEDMVLIYLR